MLILLNSLHPLSKPAVWFCIRPSAIRLENAIESDNPRRNLHVNETELLAQEERAFFVTSLYEFVDLVLELGCFFCLLLWFLCLDIVVEGWNDVTVYLRDSESVMFKLTEQKTNT